MTNITNLYNLPNVTDSDNLYTLFRYVNTESSGIFMPLILLAIFIVIFVSSISSTSLSRAFTYSCFFVGILSIIPAILGLIAIKYMYLIVLGFAIGIFWIKIENG